MENIFLPNSKIVTHIDLGWTQDEYNDFMIDMWSCYNKETILPEPENVPIVGKSVTITLTSKDYFNKST